MQQLYYVRKLLTHETIKLCVQADICPLFSDIRGGSFMTGEKWTREESILALALYCKIPFGKIHKNNELIIAAARLLDRTPSAVSMKLCNFGRFDEELKVRGVKGLKNGSHLDEEIWNEFHQDMDNLFVEAQKISGASQLILPEDQVEVPIGYEYETISKTRCGQDFFRSAVLSAYDNVCCITGLNVPTLLQASHIKSWQDSNPYTERTNPKNGLCLNALHHKAFDAGLITIDTDYKICISSHAKEHYTNEAFDLYFRKYDGHKIILPSRFLPAKEFIIYHNDQLRFF